MTRALTMAVLLAKAVLPLMEKRRAKEGLPRVEALRMAVASPAVAKVEARTLGLRKMAPRNKVASRLQVTPRKAKRPKAAHRKVTKVAYEANPPRLLVARAMLPRAAKVALPRVLAIKVVPLVQVLPTALSKSTAERSCSTRRAMPSTATAAWRSRAVRCS